MDETAIRHRIAARERARDVYCLIAEEAANISFDACEAFWDEIRKLLPPLKQANSTSGPMTDEQANIFGMSKMPFGEFKGWQVCQVPMDRLEWYSDSKFQQQLVRYLNSPKIKLVRDENENAMLDDEE
jgi:uncharacterized protein (DUF3820 family)